MKGGSVRFWAISIIAVVSLVANMVLWKYSKNDNIEATKEEFSPQQLAIQKTDPALQRSDNNSALTQSENPLTLNCDKVLNNSKRQLLQHVENKDYSALAADLIESGYPESLVKLLIYSYLNIQESGENTGTSNSYWRLQNVSPTDSAAAFLQSNQEKREQLLRIFGDSIKDDPQFYTLFRPYQNSLAYLSSDKQIKLQKLQLTAITGGTMKSPAELEQEIEDILGPEEYYEYQLRESPMAKQLQQELVAFKYSEQDYREIFRIKHEYNHQLYSGNGLPVQSASLSGADFGLNGINQSENPAEEEAIRALLGEERYHEYTLSKRPDFRRFVGVANANGVDREKSIVAYDVLQRARSQMTELHQDTNLNSDEKSYQLGAVLNDTNVQLSTLVGETIAEKLVSEVLEGPKLYRTN